MTREWCFFPLMLVFTTSCLGKFMEGACETYSAVGHYRCFHEDYESDCDGWTETVYHEYDTCADLGYTKRGAGGVGWESPSGIDSPGDYGAFSGESDGSSGSGSGGATGTYSYSFTCSSGDSYTADIPNDRCSSASERYIQVFGCNEIDSFYSACVEYYSCYGASTAECSYYQ